MRLGIVAFIAVFLVGAKAPGTVQEYQSRLRTAADRLLESADVSYVFGGHTVGSPRACRECTTCLEEKAPGPKARLSSCPICEQCGIDCSHFTQRVFEDAGFSYPYLETKAMLSLPPQVLKRRYGLIAVEGDAGRAL